MRIVIFANGSMTDEAALRRQLRPTDRIFCADGGAKNALALELTPHLVVGDMDSLPGETVSRLETAGTAIHRHPADKDQTDLELAFELAIAEQPDEILLVTALGGRLDQTLANILLLSRPEYASARLRLADGSQTVTLLRGPDCFTLSGQAGDTLSLIPLTPTVALESLAGVAWPLERVSLSLGSTWTISNRLSGSQATVEIGEGIVLLVHIPAPVDEI